MKLSFSSAGCKLRKWLILLCSVTLIPTVTANVNVTFSVDMSLMITTGKFNSSTDAVYIKGDFNGWGQTNPLTKGSGNIYSVTLSMKENSYQQYKYFITSASPENSGWENNFPVAQNGNRILTIGVKELVLATVFFNDGDLNLKKTTANFVFHYTPQDASIIDEFSARAEKFLAGTSRSLQITPSKPTEIYFYKDLNQLHLAQGYPENPDYSTGSAYGTSLFIMLSPSKMVFNDALGLFAHEFTHCLNAWKTSVIMPAWLNEGVACYYSRMFASKDYIKNDILKNGKPKMEEVFKGDMGYAYSAIIAYFIILTKGETAMAKFIQNMNYADIGYSGLSALQSDWHAFLDTYLDDQTRVNIKFSVDMADMIAAKYFSPATDKVFLRGSWSSWTNRQMTLESGTIYSITLPHNIYNSFYEYKFYTNSPTAPNGGMEMNVDETVTGNRPLDVKGTALNCPVVKFNTMIVPTIDMAPIENKIGVLKHHGHRGGTPDFSTFTYPFKIISAADYETQKPSGNLPFDAGFVTADGTITLCPPTTDAQKAIFPDISKAALYYLCQSYMYYFYQTREMPLIFKVGFAAYESGLNPADSIVKKAVNAFGNTFASFDVLNNPATFTENNGFAIAGAFGEFMNIFKNWGYPNITSINAGSFDVAPWWWNVNSLTGLLGDFNRYVYARFLEPDKNLRIQIVKETEHFRFYTRPIDAALNFPYFSDVLEPAYVEYTTNFKVKTYEKFSYFTLPTCVDGELEGVSCNGLPPDRITGGTAWSSGVHSTCASTSDQLPMFYGMNRHEFAHAIQGLMPQGTVTAWLNEGFPTFCSDGPVTEAKLAVIRDQGKTALTAGTAYFGHRPTYEDTRVYPNPDYGYYTLGYILNDYIFKKGGYQLLKDVQMNDLAAYNSLGYPTAQAFLDDFYFYFDVWIQEIPMVSLISPVKNTEVKTTSVPISWTPLKAGVKLNVSVSTTGGGSWVEIVSKTSGTSCNWNAGSYSGPFWLKFTAPDNLGLSETYGPFDLVNLNKLTLKEPTAGTILIAGDTTLITWANTSVSSVKTDFSSNNGTTWITVNPNVNAAAQKIVWVVPNTVSPECKLRISDVFNPSNLDESDLVFRIVNPNEKGGPYLWDKNTLALFHFDNDLTNRSALTGNATGNIQQIVTDSGLLPDLGNCLKTSGELSVPHSSVLNLTGDWTLEAWVKFNSFSNDHMYLFNKPGNTNPYESNYSLELNPWWGNVFFGFYFSGADARIGAVSTKPPLNEWVHVAFIRDTKKSMVSLILHDKNRNLISSGEAPYTVATTYLNTSNLLIGSGIDGFLDEVRISNVVRSFNPVTSNREWKTSCRPDLKMTVFPQPATDHFQVSINGTTGQGKYTLIISDLSGKTIRQSEFSGTQTMVDRNSLPRGLFLIQVRSKETGSTFTSKLSLQ